jgi:hypothetical protein
MKNYVKRCLEGGWTKIDLALGKNTLRPVSTGLLFDPIDPMFLSS